MVWESVWNHLEAREGLVGVRADQGRFSLGQPVAGEEQVARMMLCGGDYPDLCGTHLPSLVFLQLVRAGSRLSRAICV